MNKQEDSVWRALLLQVIFPFSVMDQLIYFWSPVAFSNTQQWNTSLAKAPYQGDVKY